MTGLRAPAYVALAALLLGVPCASAIAASPFAVTLLGQQPGSGKTFACFKREYDKAHLASHPAQNLTAMEILVTYYGGGQQSYQLRMGLRFRDRPEELTTVAECGSRDPANWRGTSICSGPSEGETQLHLNGRNTLLVTLPSGIHLWKPGPPDPQHTVDDAFGADDSLLRLDRSPTSACIDQAFDDEKRLPSRQP